MSVIWLLACTPAVGDSASTDTEFSCDAPRRFYSDADADGYGDPATAIRRCEQPEGLVSDDRDCDDTNPDVHPTAAEICDSVDEDCDGEVDEYAGPVWYADEDGDGWGDEDADTVKACSAPQGYAREGDCDDSDDSVSPTRDEDCGSGKDDDCDGAADCEDSACVDDSHCVENDCTDGLDGEGDGYTDCEDDECWGHEACVVGRSALVNGGNMEWGRYLRTSFSSHYFSGQYLYGEIRIYAEHGTTECTWTLDGGVYGFDYFSQDQSSPWSSVVHGEPLIEEGCPVTSLAFPTGLTMGDKVVWHDEGAFLAFAANPYGWFNSFSGYYNSYYSDTLKPGDPWTLD